MYYYHVSYTIKEKLYVHGEFRKDFLAILTSPIEYESDIIEIKKALAKEHNCYDINSVLIDNIFPLKGEFRV